MELKEILEIRDKLRKEYEIAEQNTPYAKTIEKIKKTEKHIRELEKRINKLENKAKKQKIKHYEKLKNLPTGYATTTLNLIAQELIRRNTHFKSYYVIGPFGYTCESSIWFYEDELGYTENLERIKASLTFWSDDKVWTGEETNHYKKGSIGWLNGENKIMKKFTSIKDLNELLNELYKKRAEGN